MIAEENSMANLLKNSGFFANFVDFCILSSRSCYFTIVILPLPKNVQK